MSDRAYIAIWNGKCQAIAAEDIHDIKKVKSGWIKQGATEIILLPKEDAKQRFIKDFEA